MLWHQREAQNTSVADKVYSIGGKSVDSAGLTALPEFGPHPWPAVVVCRLLRIGFQHRCERGLARLTPAADRDVDQFVAG